MQSLARVILDETLNPGRDIQVIFYLLQFLQNTLNVITPQNWCLIRWRLLLSGYRSVLVRKTPQIKNMICV